MCTLHTMYISEANCTFENLDLEDIETRNKYVSKTPTTTLPFLETKEGNISETNAILFYFANKYKKDLLGKDIFENSKIHQWIEFASCEINNCQKTIIYPIFGWSEFSKDQSENKNIKLKEFLKILEKELENKNYLIGNRLTLADIILFRYFRFFMMFQFTEGMRNKLLPNVTKWFENIMKTNEAIKAYGNTILCKIPLKPFMQKINKKIIIKVQKEKNTEKIEKENKNNEELMKKVSENNTSEQLLPQNFTLEEFKKCFLDNKNKEEVLKQFWKIYNSKEYSIWWLDQQNLPDKGKILKTTSNVKNLFLRKLENLKKNCFAVHGVYGSEGNYKIRGVWMWKGKDIPKEIENSEYYDYMTIRELDNNHKEDIELVNDYWTKLSKTDKVQGRYAVDCDYFN